ncbi:MAG TPA: hypothetical protein VJV79_31465 [Polyangiaceae bacterium]|nr:hypothetical protein [Polyangiaceae bacterium]
MTKQGADLPQRLHREGATDLEQRLLEAAGREQPSAELSDRMARAIGISMSASGITSTGGAKAGTATVKAGNASSSLVPWITGGVVAVGVAVGAFVATRPSATPSVASATPSASVATLLVATPESTPAVETPPSDAPAVDEPTSRPAASPALPRGRRGTAARELANQIVLVDAARSALASGSAQHALSIVRDYQSRYPSGTFRPEVSAVKIEALVKMGRATEARTLAERFVVAYGPGPLADRVARLAHIAEP